MQINYYQLLGVAMDASQADIEAACQQQWISLEHGTTPDINGLVILREVHQALSDPLRRQMYDQTLAMRKSKPGVFRKDARQHLRETSRERTLFQCLILVMLLSVWFMLWESTHRPHTPDAVMMAAKPSATVRKNNSGPDAPPARQKATFKLTRNERASIG